MTAADHIWASLRVLRSMRTHFNNLLPAGSVPRDELATVFTAIDELDIALKTLAQAVELDQQLEDDMRLMSTIDLLKMLHEEINEDHD